jgi:hypothetical protein
MGQQGFEVVDHAPPYLRAESRQRIGNHAIGKRTLSQTGNSGDSVQQGMPQTPATECGGIKRRRIPARPYRGRCEHRLDHALSRQGRMQPAGMIDG